MDMILKTLAWIESHPVTGAALLAAAGAMILAVWRYFSSRLGKSPYMDSVFYSLGKNYIVVAVHEYVPSDDGSGYKQTQHSLPDQWSKLIHINTSLFGLRHKIVPVDTSAHLAVVIRPNKKYGEKIVRFNR